MTKTIKASQREAFFLPFIHLLTKLNLNNNKEIQ